VIRRTGRSQPPNTIDETVAAPVVVIDISLGRDTHTLTRHGDCIDARGKRNGCQAERERAVHDAEPTAYPMTSAPLQSH